MGTVTAKELKNRTGEVLRRVASAGDRAVLRLHRIHLGEVYYLFY